ncbi:MAG: hypothetical protein H7Y32_04325, partial [Chloroflexales bacterium]|nr:hypothetical protein [Chloroflexales bacterium]
MSDPSPTAVAPPVVLFGSGGAVGIASGPAFVYAPRAQAGAATPGDVASALALLSRTQHDVAARLEQ